MKSNEQEKHTGYIPSINCVNCKNKILKATEGLVEEIDVNIATKRITYLTSDNEAVTAKLSAINYPIVQQNNDAHSNNKFKIIVGLCASLFFISKMILLHFLKLDLPLFNSNIIELIIATSVQLIIGQEYLRSAFNDIKYRTYGMNFLVALSTSIAYIYSVILILLASDEMLFFEIQVVLLTTIYIGQEIEKSIKNKANKEVKELLDTDSKPVLCKRGNDFELKFIEFIQVQDIIKIRPGEKIPLDGKVINGSSKLNESLLTGEEDLITKTIGDKVISGSINVEQTIELEVTNNYQDSYINTLISQIDDVSNSKPRVQLLGDKIIQIFVPVIVGLSLLTFAYWYTTTGDFSQAIYIALSTLIIACPCALGLATPISFMIGNRKFNKKQLLVRSMDNLLNANKITTIAFDKTGTLIDKQIVNIKHHQENDSSLLQLIKAIESQSAHPLAKVICNYLNNYEAQALNEQVVEQKGVGLTYQNYQIGSYRILNQDDLKKIQDYSNVFVTYDNELILEFIFDYNLREDTKATLASLNKHFQTIMITGDQATNAHSVAKKLSFDQVHTSVLPDEKIEIIKQLQADGKRVMYVGDGINDTLALAQADISVAINGDIEAVKQISDVIIINNKLQAIEDIFYISKKVRNNVYQNYLWAFSYNVFAIPLAMSGSLNPIVAGIFMMISSILVISNANRLLRI